MDVGKGRIINKTGCMIVCHNTKKIYRDRHHICNTLKLNPSSVSKCCHGKIESTKNYRLSYWEHNKYNDYTKVF